MKLLDARGTQELSDLIRAQLRIAQQPAPVLHPVVEQHRVRFSDRVVAKPSELERVVGAGVAEVQRVSELVQKRVVIALPAVRPQNEIDFLGHANR